MTKLFRGFGLSAAIMLAVFAAAIAPSQTADAKGVADLPVVEKGAVVGTTKAKADESASTTSLLTVPAAGLGMPATVGHVVTPRPAAIRGVGFVSEVEPNNTSATATPIAGSPAAIKAPVFPAADVDFYSFTAAAGDRVYVALMTSVSAGNSTDSQLNLLDTDGTTVIEFDDDNGSFAGLSSSIAGATIPAAGTYFLRVNDFNPANFERPYELYFRLQSGAPTAEVEANDTPATANPLPANGWVSGARNPAAATEQDWYSVALNAGDTVFLSMDLDPERDNVTYNGRLGFGLFGDATNQILVVDDVGTGDVLPVPNRPSEALWITVKTAGTYFAFADSATAATGGPTATYNLSVTVFPAVPEGVNCTTYTSTNVPQAIGPGTGLVSSVITVPGNPRIADLDVDIVLNHLLMQDIDAHLRSPAGNDNGLFTDIGAAAVGGQAQMDIVFDDEAGTPIPSFTVLRGLVVKPENTSTTGTASTSGGYRLAAYDGENAGGTWTLDLRDDTANVNGGTLTAWSLRICEAPPPPTCAPGMVPQTVLSTDFEAGAAGFTHTGAQDEWELGLPATVATTIANPVAGFSTCNSGVNCWKTDLDNTYNASSNQDLLSPNINLAGLSPPVVVSWAQRHQVETANFDHMFVDFQQVGGGTPVRLYEWLDPTPISATAGTGNPQVNIGGSYGWGVQSRRADSLAGLNTELRFHLDTDTSVQFGGLAVDDVSVTACRLATADLSITKTDGVTTAVPGGNVTYTITASNAGTDPVTGATVADTFPASLTCNWTCVGAGGGTCTAAGAGNINDATVNLPVGGSVTYTATCAVASSATGTLSNTATVTSTTTDPVPANNSATDTDTLTPQADLAITKTDGVTTAVPGGGVTYTITASNPGPSNAPGATVADTFPASLTCTWTCVGAGGSTCTAAGSGNINDTVNLTSGGSATYTAICSIAASATGTLTNTATVAAPAGVTDPVPANNSATDTDTLTPQGDLSITKTDGVTTITPGGFLTYTIVASNSGGGSNATGATVADTFPAAETCNWTCVGAGGGTCTAAGAGNITDTVNLPSAGSVTYTAGCTVGAATPDATVLSNTATVTAPAGFTDTNAANNAATDTTTVNANADVSISKTDGLTAVAAGGTLTYTITASNAGPVAASATIADTFPAQETCTWTCAGAGGGTCTAAGSGNITDTASLPSAGSVTYTAICTVAAGTANGTVLTNTATAAVGAGVTDPDLTNNSATDTTTVSASADLSITKTDGLTSVSAGGTLTYTIVASNAGPDSATATVADTFPVEETCTWTCAGTGGGTCAATGSGNINDATVTLPSAGSVTYTATCIVGAATVSGTVLSNTATVAIGVGASDPNAGNDSATDITTVTSGATFTATKTVSGGSFQPGGTVTYTVVLNNGGAGAQADNPGNEFIDVLPAQLTLVSATATSGTAVATVATNTVTWNGALAAGGSVTITINATINPGTAGLISNQGTANFDADGNGTNESSVLTDDSGVAGGANPTVFGVLSAIPSLGRYGLLLLALALLAMGAMYGRRRLQR